MYVFVGNGGVFSTLKMLVTVSQLEVLVYDLDHVIIFPLINTLCSVSDDSLLAVS